MICTWKDCKEEAQYPQIATDGDEWSNLCVKHHAELDEAIGAEPKKMLRAWVLAMGGAEKATRRVMRI
jgi:hypothetical protein